MYVIVEINGQQFKAEQGKKLFVHHIQNAESGAVVEFDKVLLVDNNGEVTVGVPTVEGAKVVCEVLSPLVKGDKVLDAVYTPIGLDIGAQTPAEIGVAIIAEIIEVKNRKKRTYGYSKEIMRALTAQEPYPEKKIMATIITRHGSAPQGLGTKMLIYRDGRCVGTIGGGCMEARVIQIARLMAAGEGEQ